MSKAMRQMPGRPGRVSAAHGEAVRDLISDEASGQRVPMAEIIIAQRGGRENTEQTEITE